MLQAVWNVRATLRLVVALARAGLLLFFATSGALAQPLRSGAGFADSSAGVAQAVSAAKAGLAQDQAKLALVFENTSDGQGAIVSALRAALGPEVPIVGAQEANKAYTPFSNGHYSAEAAPEAIAILLLGGDAISSVSVAASDTPASYEDPDALSAADRAALTTVGNTLGARLSPRPDQKNLILLHGALHTPINEVVVAGLQAQLGAPLPPYLKIVGFSGSYWGSRVYDGSARREATSVVAVMITGTFDWSISGEDQSKENEAVWHGSEPTPLYAKHFGIVTSELGGPPDAVFLVIGHPARATWPAIGETAALAFGAGTATIGTEGGSEVGHLSTTADVSAVRAHFFVAGIKGHADSPQVGGATSGGATSGGATSGGAGGTDVERGGNETAQGAIGPTEAGSALSSGRDSGGTQPLPGAVPGDVEAEAGCGCRVPARPRAPLPVLGGLALALALAALGRRRG